MDTDVTPVAVDLYFIPIETRIPFKFGRETLTSVTCARVCMTVADAQGRKALGWGETPLSVQWAWPSSLSYQQRADAMQLFCRMLAQAWARFDRQGHPIEVGHDFVEFVLPALLGELNAKRGEQREAMPHLAALVCCSAFDIALHDAYGRLIGGDVYSNIGTSWPRVSLPVCTSGDVPPGY